MPIIKFQNKKQEGTGFDKIFIDSELKDSGLWKIECVVYK